jgi:hypothetical protein
LLLGDGWGLGVVGVVGVLGGERLLIAASSDAW